MSWCDIKLRRSRRVQCVYVWDPEDTYQEGVDPRNVVDRQPQEGDWMRVCIQTFNFLPQMGALHTTLEPFSNYCIYAYLFNNNSKLWGYNTTQWWRICGAIGGLKQPVTYIQRETAEIIQPCNMEEGIQPGSHLCIVKHFGYVWEIYSGSHHANWDGVSTEFDRRS